VAGKGEYIHKHKFYTLQDNPDNPDSRFVEMEIVGPRIKLKPGESCSISSSYEAVKGKLSEVPQLKQGFIPAAGKKK
jgi:hypothetical protein